MIQRDELDFLPEDYLPHKRCQRNVWTGSAVAAVMVVVMAIAVFRAERALMVVEMRHAAVLRQFDQANVAFNQLLKRHQADRELVNRAVIDASLMNRLPSSDLLAELTNRLPPGASLTDMNLDSHAKPQEANSGTSTFDMKKAALESRRRVETLCLSRAPEQELVIKISGLAETDVQVAHYLNDLSHSALFGDVSLIVSETYLVPGQKKPLSRRFQIQMTVQMGAELPRRLSDGETKTASTE